MHADEFEIKKHLEFPTVKAQSIKPSLAELVLNLKKWGYHLIDIVSVASVFWAGEKTIVALEVSEFSDRISPNKTIIYFDSMAPVLLSGYKWWPERKILDLLFEVKGLQPSVGSRVHIPRE